MNSLILRIYLYHDFLHKSRGYKVKNTLRITVLLQFISRSQIGIVNVTVFLYSHVVQFSENILS